MQTMNIFSHILGRVILQMLTVRVEVNIVFVKYFVDNILVPRYLLEVPQDSTLSVDYLT